MAILYLRLLYQPDDNVNFFNADAFFTWDFRYGSRLLLGIRMVG